MKLNGIFGTGSGKVGASVWAVNGGVQIVRPYQPNVSNPNTDAQVAQRAKFKLMSQIAADIASVLAYSKDGLKSVRNQFVSRNIGLATYENEGAQVNYENLQLTKGTAAVGALDASFNQDMKIVCIMEKALAKGISRVVYVLARVNDGSRIEILDSAVVSQPGQTNDFKHEFNTQSGNLIVYAYGIKNETAAGATKFENYKIVYADDVARLVTSGSLTISDAVVTETTAMLVE